MTQNYALTNARIDTITQGVIESGSLIVKDGKIAAVGKDLDLSQVERKIDLTGAWVTPGLIDPHTHISDFAEPGMKDSRVQWDGNEMSNPVVPEVRARDALNPFDPAIKKVRNAGFTSACTLPGSGNIICGTGVVYKLRGRVAEEMMYPHIAPMKFALGENPKSNYGERHIITTRMGNAAVFRRHLYDAVVYRDKKADAEKRGDFFAKDFRQEALLPVVEGKTRCRIHSHRADDIVTAVKIAQEFGLKFSIEHCTEGYRIKDFLAENQVTAVVGPLNMTPYKQEIWGLRLENAAELAAAGVNICLTADTSSHTCYLPLEAGILTAYGLDPKVALEAITINAARLLEIDDRVGSLEVGKDADIAVFDGNPLSNFTRCRMTIIDGEIYHDEPADSYLELDYFAFQD